MTLEFPRSFSDRAPIWRELSTVARWGAVFFYSADSFCVTIWNVPEKLYLTLFVIRPVSEFHKGTRLKIIWPVDVKLIQWILIFRNAVCDFLFHMQFDHLITWYHSCTLHHCDWCHNLPSPRQLRQSNTKGDKCTIDHLRIHLPLQCFHLLFTFFWSRWFVHHPNFTPNAAFFKGANLHWKRNKPWGTFCDLR